MAANTPPYIQFPKSKHRRWLGVILMSVGFMPLGLTTSAQAEPLTAAAPNPAPISIELNQLSPLDSGCRLSFMAQNRTGVDIEKLVLETVLFDTSGAVATLSLFDFQTLPDGKPRVRQFDLVGTSCTQLGQVLINGVATCEGSTPADCQKSLSLTSRTKNELLG